MRNTKTINFRQEIIDKILGQDTTQYNYFNGYTGNWKQANDSLLLDGFDLNNDEHFCMFIPSGETQTFQYDEPEEEPESTLIDFDFSYLLKDGKKYDKPRLIIANSYTWPSLCYRVMARYGDYLVVIEGDRSDLRFRHQQMVLHKTGMIVADQYHYGRTVSMHKAARTLAKQNVPVDAAVDYVRNMYN